jgi:hypothetical protein
LSWEAVAALASVVIAFCAFVLTVWQVVTTRRHNRLSVKPFLTTWTDSDYDENRYGIELTNNGVGPALIKSFTIEVDGKKVSGEVSDQVKNALKILFPQREYTSSQSYVGLGYMMSAKEKRHLVDVQFTGNNLPKPDEVLQKLKRARLVIDYESIYREKYCLDTDEFKPS